MFYNGYNVKLDHSMTDTVIDYSNCRSKSRAIRRAKKHKQNTRIIKKPKSDVYIFDNSIIMHPDTWKKFQEKTYVSRIANFSGFNFYS